MSRIKSKGTLPERLLSKELKKRKYTSLNIQTKLPVSQILFFVERK